MENIEKIKESLSNHEIQILPYLNESFNEICKKSGLDETSVLRALRYLANKKIIDLSFSKKEVVDVGVNGALYRKKGLPERRLIHLLSEKRILKLEDSQKESNLSDDEFKASLGVLKKKALIELKNGKISLSGSLSEVSKKMLEEMFLESLPLEVASLKPEQLFALKSLKNRKDVVQTKEERSVDIKITELGKKLSASKIKTQEMIEQLTPEIIKRDLWRGKKFRRYDVVSPLPEISGGKRHFVNQATDYARKIWTDMGFKEMTGNLVVSSFWNFDALFQPQDHPARDMQDTFFLFEKREDFDKKIMKSVKEAHEKGVERSKGWNYAWDEEEAKRLILRTHTTAISSKTLSELKEKDIPAKFFAIGKVFRNETADWSHGFEFNQTEGIVVDKNVNFRHLLGYLKEFFNKMGFEKIRFFPCYYPFTEPSVEIRVFHPEKKIWFELGGAGIFRPEVTIPLFGENVNVLAWGPGFDRILMDYYQIKDLRDLYRNDLTKLREMKFWGK
ncbi:MAG: phenylalanine--tRNA ligase subunit alpha [Nanoarchaeota archaeon]|nr:phenylalanine--tRNA ligase subunit alpha [Nanoarchaeota archaeon]